MKNSAIFAVTALMLASFCGCGPQDQPKFTFEASTGIDSWLTHGAVYGLVDWRKTSGMQIANTLSPSAERASSGARSLKSVAILDGKGEDQVEICFKMPQTLGATQDVQGKVYKVRVFVPLYDLSLRFDYFQLQAKDAEGTDYPILSGAVEPGRWNTLTYAFPEASAQYDALTEINLIIKKKSGSPGAGKATFYIDDIDFFCCGCRQSSPDYTFENAATVNSWIQDGDIFAGVDWNGWGTANIISPSMVYANGGARSLKSVAVLNGQGEDQVEICFKMRQTLGATQDVQGKIYKARVLAPVDDLSAKFDFYQLQLKDALGTNYPILSGTVVPGCWSTLTYAFPEGAQYDAVSEINLIAKKNGGSPGAGTATLYIDDIGIYKCCTDDYNVRRCGCPPPGLKYSFESSTNIDSWLRNLSIIGLVDWSTAQFPVSLHANTEYADGGARSLKITARLNGQGEDQVEIRFKMLQTLGATQDVQGKIYKVRVFVPNGDLSAQFDFYQLQVKDAAGGINHPILNGTVVPGRWSTLTYAFSEGTQYDGATELNLLMKKSGGSPGAGTATLYIDSIEFYRCCCPPPGPQYSFESSTGINSWIHDGDIYAGVDWNGWGTANSISAGTDQVAEGAQSLKSVAVLDGQGEDQVEFCFKMQPTLGAIQDAQGGIYKVRVFVPNGDLSAQFDYYQLQICDVDGINYPILSGTVRPGSWSTLTYAFPEGAQYDRVFEINLLIKKNGGSPGAGRATFYIDGINFYKCCCPVD